MKQHNEFNSEEESRLNEQHTTQNTVREYSTVEELLRDDAARIAVPAAVGQRLQKSSADFPKPARSWWKKLFQR